MSDNILSEEELAAEQVGPGDDEAQVEQQAEEPTQERARDEHGRFVKTDAEQAAEAATEQPQQQQQKGDGKVPQGALHAERERRKAAEKAVEEANQALERIRQLRTSAQQPTEQQPAQQGEESEVEYLKRRLNELETGQKETTNFLRNQQFDAAESHQLVSTLNIAENEFRAEHPDYDDAINHVVGARAQELALYGLNPVEIDQTIREEIAEIARAAIQQKRNPAEVGYELARLRGYVPQQGEQQQTTTNGSGRAAATVAAVGRAQQQSKSLGQAAGGATAQTINAETIARMSQAEFDELYATPEGKALIDSL